MWPDGWTVVPVAGVSVDISAPPFHAECTWPTKTARDDVSTIIEINDTLRLLERRWLHEPGLPQRPWFRNLYAATDPYSGYAAWMLPGLRHHVEQGAHEGLREAERLYIEVFRSLQRAVESISTHLPD